MVNQVSEVIKYMWFLLCYFVEKNDNLKFSIFSLYLSAFLDTKGKKQK